MSLQILTFQLSVFSKMPRSATPKQNGSLSYTKSSDNAEMAESSLLSRITIVTRNMAKKAELRAKKLEGKQPRWDSNLQRILHVEEMRTRENQREDYPTKDDGAAATKEHLPDIECFQLDCADLEAPWLDLDVPRTPSPRRREEEEQNSTRAATVIADSPEPQSPPERQSPPRYRMTNMVRAARIPGLENRR